MGEYLDLRRGESVKEKRENFYTFREPNSHYSVIPVPV
jgi:hypothetical protein